MNIHGNIWLNGPNGLKVGAGRKHLLDAIRHTGSISAAAKKTGMSYRHAWEMVEDMNRRSVVPLVEKATGGRFGGGARLTPEGEKVVAEFEDVSKRFKIFIETARS